MYFQGWKLRNFNIRIDLGFLRDYGSSTYRVKILDELRIVKKNTRTFDLRNSAMFTPEIVEADQVYNVIQFPNSSIMSLAY